MDILAILDGEINMEILLREENKATIVSVKGKMDAVTTPEFDKKLEERISKGVKNLIIDFNELTYISSAGLRSLLSAAKRLKKIKGKILFAAIKGSVKNVFDISGFASIFEIFDSVEDALQRV
jgi:anti-anti-sigma factor